MYPWLWFWAPQWHLPWSGDVSLNIHPDTDWFSQNIKEEGAGNASIERRAFAIASYGKQLGLITEILIAVAEQQSDLSNEAATSLERLKKIKAAIEMLKSTTE